MTHASASGHTWAIVLAAGSGTRLSELTCDSTGTAVPKQFCTLNGESTLMEQALLRACSVVDPKRVTTIVSAAHRRYWQPLLRDMAPDNITVQPSNRGTAIGILLPVLQVASRDHEARILILPSDHHVDEEAILTRTIHRTLEEIREHPAGVALLGIEADEPDAELGYIVPQPIGHPCFSGVRCFAEKPPADEAASLIRAGALWNSFILVCRASSLIDLIRQAYPAVVQHLQEALRARDEAVLEEAYRELPDVDFSRHIATGRERQLAIVTVPRCGWNDLGTPDRLARTVARLPKARKTPRTRAPDWINLASRVAQMHPLPAPDA